nr:MAG TPA: hypothetical protein [Caudoviricetes sp.]
MACIGLILGDQTLGCGPALNAPLGRPISAKIINASQIASYTIGGSPEVATITRVAGAPAAALVETSNGALNVSIGMKGGEVAPQALDPTISMTLFKSDFVTSALGSTNSVGMNSQVVIAVDHGNDIYRVYGLGYPLECLSIEGDTDGNGFIRTTFGVEDWQPGTTVYRMSAADYAALSKAVGGKVTPPSGGGDGPTLDEDPLG